MRTWLKAMGVAAVTAGCANVRVAQQDGCWVRETVSFPKQMKQEVGPCMRQEPRWSEDRLTRLIQECQAEADYRWQNSALAAWSQGQAFQAPPPDAETRRACMNDALTAAVSENETLKNRLLQVATENEQLQRRDQESLAHLRASHDRLTDALGKAAVRPAPSATASATASSDTRAQTSATTPRVTAPTATKPSMGCPLPRPSLEKASSPMPEGNPGASRIDNPCG